MWSTKSQENTVKNQAVMAVSHYVTEMCFAASTIRITHSRARGGLEHPVKTSAG